MEKDKVITREQFVEYERVRKSGVTNMLDVGMVGALAKLSRKEVIAIISHYSELSDKYPDVIEEAKQ